VVIQTKQHLAALVPSGSALVLNLLRWGDEIKTFDGLELPGNGVSFSAAEKKMAEQLVNEMTGDWDPEAFKDEFKHAIMALVDKKVKAGKTEAVVEPEEQAPSQGADIIDLTALLARSLKGGGRTGGDGSNGGSSGSSGSGKPATKNGAKKTASKSSASKSGGAASAPSGLALSAKTAGTKLTGAAKAKKTTKGADKAGVKEGATAPTKAAAKRSGTASAKRSLASAAKASSAPKTKRAA